MQTTHPATDSGITRDKLRAYLAGWLSPEECQQIENQLDGNLDYQTWLGEIETESDSLLKSIVADQRSTATSRGPNNIATADSEQMVPSACPSDNGAVDNSNKPAIDYALERAKRLIHGENLPENTLPFQWQPPSDSIGPYELLHKLGQGGMGSVYLARHRQLNKRVAIKLLPVQAFHDTHSAARFHREIRAAGQLNHPTIINATDAGQCDSVHYLVMEYIDGLDLSRLARSLKQLDVAEACELVRQVAIGLSYAHAEGIVHRDIKPSNIMLSATGQVKILDFGLAQTGPWDQPGAELTTVGQLLGTLDYMSPEQADRPESVDYRTDLYSLGATLFRLLTGRAPLAATPNLSPLAKLRLLGTHQPPRLDSLRSDVPQALVELVGGLLSRDPDQRPPSAAHVAEQLAQLATDADLPSLWLKVQAARTLQANEPLSVLSNPIDSTVGSLLAPKAQVAGEVTLQPSSRKWPLWLGGFAMAPMLWAAIVMVLNTQQGQLIIEAESGVNNVSVSLLRDGKFYQEIRVEPGANTTRLYSGQYQIEIDAGTDGIELDRDQVTISKGQTVIARVRKIATSIESARSDTRSNAVTSTRPVPPASDAILQPGDEFVLTSGTEKELKGNFVVQADRTVKLPALGLVDVTNFDLQQLQDKLNVLYLSFWKEPSIELFRVLSAPVITYSEPPQSPAATTLGSSRTASSVPNQTDGNSELKCEGKTLSKWLEVFRLERSPQAVSEALFALRMLKNSTNHEHIADVLWHELPLHSNYRVNSVAFNEKVTPDYQELDTLTLRLLRSCYVDEEAWNRKILEQLSAADNQWAQRIIVAFGSDTGLEFEPSGKGLEPLVDWLDINVLRSNERPQLLYVTAAWLMRMACSTDSQAIKTLQDKIMQLLHNCQQLDFGFWLDMESRFSFQLNQGWSLSQNYPSAVAQDAIETLSNSVSNDEQVILAAIYLLKTRRAENVETKDYPAAERQQLVAELKRRLTSELTRTDYSPTFVNVPATLSEFVSKRTQFMDGHGDVLSDFK
jgi:serine/threonine protein kinase